MGDVVFGGKFPYAMYREFSWLMNGKGLEVFLFSLPETLPVSKMQIPDGEFFGTGQKCHPT
jgi:hypothetical protein